MEYRSPLGYNFKLERSLTASREEDGRESPKRDDFVNGGNRRSNKFFDSDSRRNSASRNSYSPAWQRHSNQWKSPRNSQQHEPPPVELYYHPSMMENPWEELEKNLNVSKKE